MTERQFSVLKDYDIVTGYPTYEWKTEEELTTDDKRYLVRKLQSEWENTPNEQRKEFLHKLLHEQV